MQKKVIMASLGLGVPLLLISCLLLLIIFIASSDDDNDCAVTTETSSNVVTSADMNKNAKTIYQFLRTNKDVKATPQAAAGILGVWQFESQLNPSVKNTGGSGATGLAQWMSNRYDNLMSFAAKNNKKWNSLDAQLNFMVYEMAMAIKVQKHIF